MTYLPPYSRSDRTFAVALGVKKQLSINYLNYLSLTYFSYTLSKLTYTSSYQTNTFSYLAYYRLSYLTPTLPDFVLLSYLI